MTKKTEGPPPKKPKKLTAKEEQFCREYLIDLNGTQAAIRSGYSKKSAKMIAYENLTKPYIQDRLSELKAMSVKRVANEMELDISADRILKEVMSMAYSNIADYMQVGPDGVPYVSIVGEDGKLIPREVLAGLTGFEIVEMPPVEDEGLPRQVLKMKVKMDKTKALEMLMKHKKLLGAEEVNVNINQVDELIQKLEMSLKARGINPEKVG